MRIHTSAPRAAILEAARVARVDFDRLSEHRSRSADHAFDVKLTGESRRRPNGGTTGAGGDYAATWDQWGVFLSAIFAVDPSAHCWAYAGVEDFDRKTAGRFSEAFTWPDDAHGDHRFDFVGVPRSQSCTRCTATRTW